MKKHWMSVGMSLAMMMALTACQQQSAIETSNNTTTQTQAGTDTETTSDSESTASGNSETLTEAQTITKAGTYRLTGTIDTPIVIDAKGECVVLELDNVVLSCDSDAPIVAHCKQLEIRVLDGTENEISDLRTTTSEIAKEDAVIYTKGSIVLTGTGSLKINGDYYNGIHATKTLTVEGPSIEVACTHDAIKGKNSVVINDGSITVTKSIEGIEGNVVTINNGTIDVYASDDAINACSGDETPLVQVNGGTITVKTPSGDTDAIDSNGSYIQTGGTVLVKGGASMGNMAGSVDVDGVINITGGEIVAVGGICEVPTDSVNAYAASTQLSQGTYQLTDDAGNEVLTFVLDSSYSSFWLASEQLKTGTTYTLKKDGTEVVSWTQEEGTMNEAGAGGFNWNTGGRPGNGNGGMGRPDGGNGQMEKPDGNMELPTGAFDGQEPPTGDFGDFGNFGNFEWPWKQSQKDSEETN